MSEQEKQIRTGTDQNSSRNPGNKDFETRSFEDKNTIDCNSNGWWEDRTLAQKILIGIGFGILGLGFLAALGWVVMALWNWLMPDIFGLKQITYIQAWGLLVLSFILFKNWGSGESSSKKSDKKRKRQLKKIMDES